jgi:hypothetical protein
MESESHRYGRGQFDAHPDYIAYMRTVVEHSAYAGMPNAVSDDGRINWQVSSGRSTSFYKYYDARFEWWVAKADSLGLPGKSNEQDRFTIAARQIHPTGWRACRLCGEDKNVGYYYLNALLAKRLNKLVGSDVFERGLPIDEVIDALTAEGVWEAAEELLRELFPNGRFSAAATEVQIESVEADLGVRLPEQLRRLYFECDGFREDRGNAKYLLSLTEEDFIGSNPDDALDAFNCVFAQRSWGRLRRPVIRVSFNWRNSSVSIKASTSAAPRRVHSASNTWRAPLLEIVASWMRRTSCASVAAPTGQSSIAIACAFRRRETSPINQLATSLPWPLARAASSK